MRALWFLGLVGAGAAVAAGLSSKSREDDLAAIEAGGFHPYLAESERLEAWRITQEWDSAGDARRTIESEAFAKASPGVYNAVLAEQRARFPELTGQLAPKVPSWFASTMGQTDRELAWSLMTQSANDPNAIVAGAQALPFGAQWIVLSDVVDSLRAEGVAVDLDLFPPWAHSLITAILQQGEPNA